MSKMLLSGAAGQYSGVHIQGQLQISFGLTLGGSRGRGRSYTVPGTSSTVGPDNNVTT